VTACSRLGVVVTACCRLWIVVTVCSRLGVVVTACRRLCIVVTACSRLGVVVTACWLVLVMGSIQRSQREPKNCAFCLRPSLDMIGIQPECMRLRLNDGNRCLARYELQCFIPKEVREENRRALTRGCAETERNSTVVLDLFIGSENAVLMGLK